MASCGITCATCGETQGMPLRKGLIHRLEQILDISIPQQCKPPVGQVYVCLACKAKVEKIDQLVSEFRALNRRFEDAKRRKQLEERLKIKSKQPAAVDLLGNKPPPDRDGSGLQVNQPGALLMHPVPTVTQEGLSDDEDCVSDKEDDDSINDKTPVVVTKAKKLSAKELMRINNKKEIFRVAVPLKLPEETECGCGAKYYNLTQLQRHSREEHCSLFPCPLKDCGHFMETMADLRIHIRIHNDGGMKCHYCDEVYATEKKLRLHETAIHKSAKAALRTFLKTDPERQHTAVQMLPQVSLVQRTSLLPGTSTNMEPVEETVMHISNEPQKQSLPIVYDVPTITEYPCPICDCLFLQGSALPRHISRYHWKKKDETSEVLICIFCTKEFPGVKDILPHARGHRREMVQCSRCPEVFEKKEHLEDHEFVLHEARHMNYDDSREQEVRRCSTCGHIAESKSMLSYHRLSEHSASTQLTVPRPHRRYPCNQCNASFSQTKDLKIHYKSHKPIEHPDFIMKHQCIQCKQIFTNLQDLAVHRDMGYCPGPPPGQPPPQPPKLPPFYKDSYDEYPCPVCDVQYPVESIMNRHVQEIHWKVSSTEDWKYKCCFCALTFDDLANTVTHARLHRADLMQCNFCTMTFYSKGSKSNHQREVHKVTQKNTVPTPAPSMQYRCAQCPTVTQTKSLLSFHYLTEHDTVLCMKDTSAQRPYPCKHCPCAFSKEIILNKHMQNYHADEITSFYQCSRCGKKFFSDSGLRVHIKGKRDCALPKPRQKDQHRARRRGNKCSICGKFFAKLHTFQMHVKGHSGQYKFACNLCEAKFMDEEQLKRHARFHGLSVKCKKCDWKGHSKNALRNHMLSKHSSKHYNCDLCDKIFFDPSMVTKHKFHVHGIGTFVLSKDDDLIKCKLCSQVVTVIQGRTHFETNHKDAQFSGNKFKVLVKEKEKRPRKRRATNREKDELESDETEEASSDSQSKKNADPKGNFVSMLHLTSRKPRKPTKKPRKYVPAITRKPGGMRCNLCGTEVTLENQRKHFEAMHADKRYSKFYFMNTAVDDDDDDDDDDDIDDDDENDAIAAAIDVSPPGAKHQPAPIVIQQLASGIN